MSIVVIRATEGCDHYSLQSLAHNDVHYGLTTSVTFILHTHSIVAEEASTLNSERLQSFFHQGSLFHSVKVIESCNESPVTIKNVTHQLEKEIKRPTLCKLHSNYVCSTHDLTILLSKLLRDKDVEFGHLYRLLVHIYSTFGNFVTTEKIHIVYSISKSKYADLDICKKIMERYHSEVSDGNIAYSNASNVAKLYFAFVNYGIMDGGLYKQLNKEFLMHATDGEAWTGGMNGDQREPLNSRECMTPMVPLEVAMDHELGGVSMEGPEFIGSLDDHHADAFQSPFHTNTFRSLLPANYADCRTMSRDFRLVATSMVMAGTVSYNVLKLASNFFARLLREAVGSTDKTDASVEHSGMRVQNGQDLHSDHNDHSRHPGKHTDKVYELEDEPVEWELRDLVAVLEANEAFGYNCKELLDNLHLFVTLKGSSIVDSADDLSLEIIGRKYVTRRMGWMADRMNGGSRDEQMGVQNEHSMGVHRDHSGHNSFGRLVALVDRSKRIDLLPALYSLSRETCLLFIDLKGVISHLSNILMHIFNVEKGTDLSILTSLDNCARLLGSCLEAEKERDYVDITIFGTLFRLQRFIDAQDRSSFLNSCGTIEYLNQMLVEHLEGYSASRYISFSELPSIDVFGLLVNGEGVLANGQGMAPPERTVEAFKDAIEEMHKDNIARKNLEIFKFVTHNVFLKMSSLCTPLVYRMGSMNGDQNGQ